MSAQAQKDERIEIRLSLKDKEIFKRAQRLSGDKSFSSFAVRILKSNAQRIIAENDRILASRRDQEIFFDAAFGDIKPNEALLTAAERFKTLKKQK